MRPIPIPLREEMSRKRFYKFCVVCNKEGVQYHHNLIFAGRQVNEEFCIIPLCPDCHSKADIKHNKERLDWIMLNRATDEELLKYTKAKDYFYERQRLNDTFGGAWNNPIKEE